MVDQVAIAPCTDPIQVETVMNSSGKRLLIPRGIPQPLVQRAGQKPLVAQPKSVVFAQSPRRPIAPPVYKPQPKLVQPKIANVPAKLNTPLQNMRKPIAPPVYPPQAKQGLVQAKLAGPTQIKRQLGTPVCRVQSIPKVLQTKKAISQPAAIQLAAPRIVRPSNTIQRNFARGTPVQVTEAGRTWYGVVTGPLHYRDRTYRIRVGGTNQHVEVPADRVSFHEALTGTAALVKLRERFVTAGALEERRDGDSVNTAGGTWTALEYYSRAEWFDPRRDGTHRIDGTARGLRMKLQFTPNHTVNARKIVLVQTVTVMKDEEQPHFKDDSVRARARNNISIDQAHSSVNPEYAATADRAGVFGAAPVKAGFGEHGYRYEDPLGRVFMKPAWIQDDPHVRQVQEFALHKFETTAIAAVGDDQGTYYGSVSWGYIWRREAGKVELFPLSVVESGHGASDDFRQSAIQWNSAVISGRVPVSLPLPPRIRQPE